MLKKQWKKTEIIFFEIIVETHLFLESEPENKARFIIFESKII